MVESATTDPFGVKAMIDGQADKQSLTAQRCDDLVTNNLDPQKFSFMLIMSGTMQTSGIGVMRVRAQDYFPRNDHYAGWLKKMAIADCKSRLPGGGPGKAISPATGPREFAVLRHKGGAGCSYPKKPDLQCEGKNCEAAQ